ncbi:MAG: 4a-hydroxytetrahydrobiopterin dehydratase [Actinomycetota bacterium]
MSDLAARKCESCSPDTPPLTEEETKDLLEQLDVGWGVENNMIRREIKQKNFRDAMGLAVRVGMVAEAEGHHPDLEVGYGRLGISMTTHSIGGLSDNDFILAAKIDTLIRAPE